MTINSLGIQPDELGARRPRCSGGWRDGAGDPPGGVARRPARAHHRARRAGSAPPRRAACTRAARGSRWPGSSPSALEGVAADCGGAPWFGCDVADRAQVDRTVAAAVERLGGLDVVIANAGVAAQLPLVGGDPAIFERTLAVNILGVYYTLRAAAPHISHPRGYALAVASLAAAVHLPLLGRLQRLQGGGRGAGRHAADRAALVGRPRRRRLLRRARHRHDPAGVRHPGRRPAWAGAQQVAPLSAGVDAIERGVARRSRRVVAPGWVAPLLPLRMLVQRGVDLAARRRLDAALAIAREEHAPLTTPQTPPRRWTPGMTRATRALAVAAVLAAAAAAPAAARGLARAGRHRRGRAAPRPRACSS